MLKLKDNAERTPFETSSYGFLSRWQGLRPRDAVLGACLFLAGMFALSLTGLDPYHDNPILYPALVEAPAYVWFFNIAVPLMSTLAFVLMTVECYRRKTLTWWWLFFVAASASFWGESVGDWTFYLTYSPAFWHYEFIFPFPWHVGDNPYFMPFAYGWYWGLHAYAVVKLTYWWSERSGWSELKSLLLFSIPLGYAWDLLVEGTATYFGWWEYDPPLGPYFSWEFLGGVGHMPLLVPILFPMVGWPNFIAYFAGDPDKRFSLGAIERCFNLQRLLPDSHPASPAYSGPQDVIAAPKFAWRYELHRVLAWVLTFWLTFTVMLLIPLILARYLFGHDSIYAPWPF